MTTLKTVWAVFLALSTLSAGDGGGFRPGMAGIAASGGRQTAGVRACKSACGASGHLPGVSPLGERSSANLVAFAKALNYIRYFHPSDAAAGADWDRLAAAGIARMEPADSPNDLACRLGAFFAPYAPSAVFLAPDHLAPVLSVAAGASGVTRWFHKGVGKAMPEPQVYESRRQYRKLDEPAAGWADPLAPLILHLGRGVRLSMPLVLFTDPGQRTLPAGTAAPRPPVAVPSRSVERALAGDRSVRLGDIVLAWGMLQHFYPYFDRTPVDWDLQLARSLGEAAGNLDGLAFLGTLRRMVAVLRDGHGWVDWRP